MLNTETRKEKLDLRLTAAAKKTLQRAAQASGRSVSEFVLESALARRCRTGGASNSMPSSGPRSRRRLRHRPNRRSDLRSCSKNRASSSVSAGERGAAHCKAGTTACRRRF